jgi:hypothetical protein
MNYNKTIHRVRRQRSHRHLWSISLSIAKYQWPSFRRRRSCALSATTMVERLITIAPTKGQNKPKYEITIPVVRSLSGWGCCLEAMEEPENAAVGANLRHTDWRT